MIWHRETRNGGVASSAANSGYARIADPEEADDANSVRFDHILIAGMLALPAAAQGTVAAPGQGQASAAARRRARLRPAAGTEGRAASAGAEGRAPQQAQQPAGRSARALHGARRRAAEALHRPEPRGVPQGARRDRAEEGPRRARQAGAGEGLLLDEGRGQRRRQEDRHRGARDRAQPRRQGRVGLGDAQRASPPTRPPQPYPDRPNTVCSPAGPEFKTEDLEKLVEATKTDIGDWGFTAQRRTSRCAPPRRRTRR